MTEQLKFGLLKKFIAREGSNLAVCITDLKKGQDPLS